MKNQLKAICTFILTVILITQSSASGYLGSQFPNSTDIWRNCEDCEECPPGAMDTDCQGGMVSWSVSTPFMNLWLYDKPLSYQPSQGPEVALELMHRTASRAMPLYALHTSFGDGWTSPWLSFIDAETTTKWYYPGGGELTLDLPTSIGTLDSCRDYTTNALVERTGSNGQITKFVATFPNGRQLVYETKVDEDYSRLRFHLTKIVDPHGNETTLEYDIATDNTEVLLDRVLDVDGRAVTINYVPGTNRVQSVGDVYGRTVTFGYQQNGTGPYWLTSIQDSEGIVSGVGYDSSNNWVSSITTPYGTTSFTYPHNLTAESFCVMVQEPENQFQLYGWFAQPPIGAGSTALPSFYAASEVPQQPSGNTFYNADLDENNSYHWNRQQLAKVMSDKGWSNASSIDIDDFDPLHFKIATRRHWLERTNISEPDFQTLNLEQLPSTDGSELGQLVWYDYSGKPSGNNATAGTQSLPSTMAMVLLGKANTQPWYVKRSRNAFGNITNIETSYTQPSSGNWGTRSNTFVYASNGVDLEEVKDFNGQTVRKMTWDNHKLTVLEEMPEVGTVYKSLFEYNGTRLITVTNATDLITKFTYYPSNATDTNNNNYLEKIVQYDTSTSNPIRTNKFTWKNGNIRDVTDARDLTRRFTWDYLNRLTQVEYHPGTTQASSEYFVYDNSTTNLLDLVKYTDRLGKDTLFLYDGLRRVTEVTNRNGHITKIDYCDCGSPSDVTEGFGTSEALMSQYKYDYQGNLIEKSFPNASPIQIDLYDFNRLGQLTTVTNDIGGYVNHYNTQGLLSKVERASGDYRTLTYDINDRLKTLTDDSGVVAELDYDLLGRLSKKTLNGSLVEGYSYSERGLTNYTNQLNNVWTYDNDVLGRMTDLTTPEGHLTKYRYWPAGDLKEIEDPLQHITRWEYDTEGRMVKKFNHLNLSQAILELEYNDNGWPVNRSTPTSGTTVYAYDDNGNIESIDYSNSVDITYQYDSLNRLTNMVDAAGTTIFDYSQGGQLKTENGPWAADSVTFTYNEGGMQSGLNLTNQVTFIPISGDPDLAEGLDNTDLNMFTDGDALWVKQTNQAYGGGPSPLDATASGVISHNQSSEMTTTVSGPGTLTFYWKVESEANYDYLKFYLDGALQNSISGYTSWAYQSYSLSSGTHELKWVYSKDGSVTHYADAGYVDVLSAPSGGSGGGGISPELNLAYTYDSSFRLDALSLTSPSKSFDYQYNASINGVTKPGSDLYGKIVIPSSGTVGNSFISRSFDSYGRLSSTTLTGNSAFVNKHLYFGKVDAAGRITGQELINGNTWNYGYDDDDRLTSATGNVSAYPPARIHEQFQYNYDAAGNLINRTNGVNHVTFDVNSVNRIENGYRTSNSLVVSGGAGDPLQSATINGASATVYTDDSFAKSGINISNGWANLVAEAQNTTSDTDQSDLWLELPATVAFSYDDDGNMTSMGGRTFLYDDENQLIEIEEPGEWKVEFVYDGLGRRRIQKESVYTGTGWVGTRERRYIYDRRLVIQERDEDNTSLVSYVRGLDLSGSMQGAGGIGGLLAYVDQTGSAERFAYYHSDAGGNVTALMNDDNAVVAKYSYSPYGQLLAMSGPLAQANTYRFSSKEQNVRSGLYDYGFRYYDPSLGRWINRDPLGEAGGINLYGFVVSNPTTYVDPWGLDHYDDVINNLDDGIPSMGRTLDPVRMAGGAEDAKLLKDVVMPDACDALGGPLGKLGDVRKIGKAAKAGKIARTGGKSGGFWGKVKAKVGSFFSCSKEASDGAPNILGKGSTADLAKGTRLPRNIKEQVAIGSVAANPKGGIKLPVKMTDSRWHGDDGWQKWQQIVQTSDGPINVHYVYNPMTGQLDDFKIVIPGRR